MSSLTTQEITYKDRALIEEQLFLLVLEREPPSSIYEMDFYRIPNRQSSASAFFLNIRIHTNEK